MDVVNRAFIAMMTVLPWELVFIVRRFYWSARHERMRPVHKYVRFLGRINYICIFRNCYIGISVKLPEYFQRLYAYNRVFRYYVRMHCDYTRDTNKFTDNDIGKLFHESGIIWHVIKEIPKYMHFMQDLYQLDHNIHRLNAFMGYELLVDLSHVDRFLQN